MKVIYYISLSGKNPVQEFINSLEIKQRVKIRRLLLNIQEYGLTSIVAHIKKLSGTPLWEIRILGQDNLRVFFVTKQREEIIFPEKLLQQ